MREREGELRADRGTQRETMRVRDKERDGGGWRKEN